MKVKLEQNQFWVSVVVRSDGYYLFHGFKVIEEGLYKGQVMEDIRLYEIDKRSYDAYLTEELRRFL